MKILSLIVLTLGVAAFLGCSGSPTKTQPQPVSDKVIDAGMYSSEPITVKGSGVYDAGVYRENEDYSDLATHGGKNGSVIPSEKFYGLDREKHMPVDKVFYFLTDDSPAHCIKGKYVWLKGHKSLVVYSKSNVPSNYCIYQKKFNSEAEGFSISVADGGICRPSYTNVKEDDQKRKVASIEQISNTVSMTYCVDDTVSFGEEMVRKHR